MFEVGIFNIQNNHLTQPLSLAIDPFLYHFSHKNYPYHKMNTDRNEEDRGRVNEDEATGDDFEQDYSNYFESNSNIQDEDDGGWYDDEDEDAEASGNQSRNVSYVPKESVQSRTGQATKGISTNQQQTNNNQNIKQTTKPKSTQINPANIQIPDLTGISIIGFTQQPTTVDTNLSDLFRQELDESLEYFELRKQLTLRLSEIPDYKLNPITALTLGYCIMKKARLGVSYELRVERAMAYVLERI